MRTKSNPTGVLVIVLALAIITLTTLTSTISYDATNVSTRVNVTQSKPVLLGVVIDENVGDFANITLSQGATRDIYCNASIRDYNGWDDVAGVNATFYHITSSATAADDNNDHYTNSTCTTIGNDGQYIQNFTCIFPVYFYANNGTWTCNVTVIDNYNFTDTMLNTTIMSPLYALNVTSLIDYGNLAVEDYSENMTANVTNFGNMDINLTLFGYGAAELDGLAMVCDIGNISIDNEKYSYLVDDDFVAKTALTDTATQVAGLTIFQQMNDSAASFNTTYWQLYIEPNPFGQCNGTVVFEATAP
ncbi:MAG: hypothetical protein ABIA93_01110 [Candidatus Woesearchaeota archaeon]